MEFILKDQSVQFTFAGEKYSNGKKSRILKNVKKQIGRASCRERV